MNSSENCLSWFRTDKTDAKQRHSTCFDDARMLSFVALCLTSATALFQALPTQNYPGSWNKYEFFSWIFHQIIRLGKTACEALPLNATTTALYIRVCGKSLCWWIYQRPIRVGFCPFFKAGAIKSKAVAFTNGIRAHPFLLSIVNDGFNDVDEKNKVC